MFNRIKEKQLIIVLGVLVVILVISMISGNTSKNRSFMGALTRIDTASVSSIIITPVGDEPEIVLNREGNNWTVDGGDGAWNADNRTARQMLTTLSELTAKRLAAKDKDRWNNFEVTDSLGTRVQVKNGKKTVADLVVGKFSYAPPPQQGGQPYMQQQQGTMTSYVRLTGDKEVYAVDGFLRMMFNRQTDELRDRKVLELNRNKLARISFRLPGEQFSLQRSDTRWMIDGLMADSASTAGYLASVYRLNSSAFLPGDEAPSGNPTHTVVFEDTLGVRMAEVDLFFSDSANIALESSQNPGTLFDGSADGLFEKVIMSKAGFLGEE